MTVEFQMDSLQNLVDHAIELLRAYQPSDRPYWGCCSFGKDSVVIIELARMAGVRVQWHYNVTTIDPPELCRFGRREYPEVEWHRPKKNFWEVAKTHGFPTRTSRWCCAVFKEGGTPEGNTSILGRRASESDGRAKRATCDPKIYKGAWQFDPIIKWDDHNIWQFIRGAGVKYCSLYDEGFHRLGCVGCPMAGRDGRLKEFKRWPQFETMWRRLFKYTWEKRHGTKQRDGRNWFGDRYFKNWSEMWEWWLNDLPLDHFLKARLFFGQEQ